VRTAIRGGTPEPSGEEILLADVFDAVATADWHFVTANSDEKKPKPKPPKRYPRWWEQADQQARKKAPSPERIARIEDARRRQHERREAIRRGAIA
jgi:hypothetical protein